MKTFRLVVSLLLFALLLVGCVAEREIKPISAARGLPEATSLPAAPEVSFIKFTTEDGIKLSGRLFGHGRVGVVLSHMYSTDQNSWSHTAKILSDRGFAVLTFDFRGYGLSAGIKDVSKSDRDVASAADWLRRRTNKVFLVGAGMGGTAALKTAVQGKTAGVVAMSAAPEFLGLSAGDIGAIKAPKLFMASTSDRSAPDFARRFYADANEPKEIRILSGARQGSGLTDESDGEALKALIDWLERGGTAAPTK